MRKTLYKPEYCETAKNFCLLGATDIQMADFFGVAINTLRKWKAAHPEFRKAIDEGKVYANAKVAGSLYKLAMGFTYKEMDIRVVKGEIVKTEYDKYVPPSPVSCFFFLKNRDKANWRDKQEFEHSGKVAVNDLTDDQLDAQVKALAEQVLKGKE